VSTALNIRIFRVKEKPVANLEDDFERAMDVMEEKAAEEMW